MKKKDPSLYIPLLGFALLLGAALYSFVRMGALSHELVLVSEELRAVNGQLASTSAAFAQFSSTTQETLKRHNSSLFAIEDKVGIYREQITNVASRVSTLQKLSETDPQLLAKYSKVFFLSENYAPARLTEIPADYKYSASKAVSVHASVWPKLKSMMDAARNDGVTLVISSGYRSFAEQKNLKGDYRITYGAGTANQFSADQGYSEHQLGTAVDFLTDGISGDLDRFEGTRAHTWLVSHAHIYGFILSYPKENQFYIYEPWHWRYVGTKLATDIHNQNKYFYDLDQREIDKYLVNIFE